MNEDIRWQQLVALSAPTFLGVTNPPYGFTTATLARLREESRQTAMIERIGLRAIFASLGMLVLAAGILEGARYMTTSDLEPGLNNIVQVENVAVSN